MLTADPDSPSQGSVFAVSSLLARTSLTVSPRSFNHAIARDRTFGCAEVRVLTAHIQLGDISNLGDVRGQNEELMLGAFRL